MTPRAILGERLPREHMKSNHVIFTVVGLTCLSLTSCCTNHSSTGLRSEATARQATNPAASAEAAPVENPASLANPMCGTGRTLGELRDNSNLYPGATLPFGMIQWSPDTENSRHISGYFDEDRRISDFSVDHIAGAGCGYGGDFAMMPICGAEPTAPPTERSTFALPFAHAKETAKPGYYGVTFDNGLKVELAATLRTGFGRITYPTGSPAALMLNAATDVNGSSGSGINIVPDAHEITGWCIGGHFCRTSESRTIYFYAVFNQPFASYSTWSDKVLTQGAASGHGMASGAYVTFNPTAGQPVLVKMGISYVSVDNAKANVAAENPVSAISSNDFDQVAAAATDTWNGWLNRIRVSGGTPEELATFYSILYHALLGPVVVSDANGQYTGYDGQVHTTAEGRMQYGIFSGWDIYRSQCQLLGMIAPKEASDMAQSLLLDYQQGGAFPRWGVISEDSGVMLGDPAEAMIADYYAFGATNFDSRAALAGLLHAATDPLVRDPRSKTTEREHFEDYLKLGYLPERRPGGDGSVSLTLEYDASDFALSEFAKALGDPGDSAAMLQRAQNWKHLYNPADGYLEMRRPDGSWAPGFTNNAGSYDGIRGYVEGTAAQYVWMVPFNYQALVAMMGGRKAAVQRLDAFFTKLNVGDRGPDAWMAWLGNEPCLETPWIYDFLGQPWKTQKVVRRAVMELYGLGDRGYPGNDDVGEMSAWYVFGALGMYPELPGSDILVLGSPLFPRMVVHLANQDLTIIGHGAAADAPYVQSLTVNGKAWKKPWLRYADISGGATLTYELRPVANTHWGTRPADAPPSFE